MVKISISLEQAIEGLRQLPPPMLERFIFQYQSHTVNKESVRKLQMILGIPSDVAFSPEDQFNGVMKLWFNNPLIIDGSKCTLNGLPYKVLVFEGKKMLVIDYIIDTNYEGADRHRFQESIEEHIPMRYSISGLIPLNKVELLGMMKNGLLDKERNYISVDGALNHKVFAGGHYQIYNDYNKPDRILTFVFSIKLI